MFSDPLPREFPKPRQFFPLAKNTRYSIGYFFLRAAIQDRRTFGILLQHLLLVEKSKDRTADGHGLEEHTAKGPELELIHDNITS